MTNYVIDNIFTYHPPFGTQQKRYVDLRNEAKKLAYLIQEACPESREKSLAFTNLQQTVMWANASIAINEFTEPSSEVTTADVQIPADGTCTDCHISIGGQHAPSCHRQGSATKASDYTSNPEVRINPAELG